VAKWKLNKLKLLVTSRPLADIEKALDFISAWCEGLESDLVEHDIKTYVNSRLITDRTLQWLFTLHDEVEQCLALRARGM
jgi:hypothetical protein